MRVAGRRAVQRRGPIARGFLGLLGVLLLGPIAQAADMDLVQAMPSSVLIDRRGVTRFTHEGFRPIDAAAYEAQVQELLAEK
jgi:hypothetical protein